MNPECDSRVRLSKSDKNIGAGGWRVDHLFEAADSGDVLPHPCITTMEGQRALRFNQKYLNLCSEDEQRSYMFGTSRG